jgi:hypothetical protein
MLAAFGAWGPECRYLIILCEALLIQFNMLWRKINDSSVLTLTWLNNGYLCEIFIVLYTCRYTAFNKSIVVREFVAQVLA